MQPGRHFQYPLKEVDLRERLWRTLGKNPSRPTVGAILTLAFLAIHSSSVGAQSCELLPTSVATLSPGSRVEALSADGERMILRSQSDPFGFNPQGHEQLFLFDVAESTLVQLTHFEMNGVLASRVQADATLETLAFHTPYSLSGDGSIGPERIYLLDTESGALSHLPKTEDGGPGERDPTISRDGNRLAFRSTGNLTGRNEDGSWEVFVAHLAEGALAQVSDSTPLVVPGAPSIDRFGRRLAFVERALFAPRGGARLKVVDLRTERTVSILRGDQIGEPSLSADGRRAAFVSPDDLTGGNHDAGPEVFILDVETVLGRRLEQVTYSRVLAVTNGDRNELDSALMNPSVSADGQRVAFFSMLDTAGHLVGPSYRLIIYDRRTRTFTTVPILGTVTPLHNPPLNAQGNRVGIVSSNEAAGDSPAPAAAEAVFWASCFEKGTRRLIFPQVIAGAGVRSEVLLTNTGGGLAEGTLAFLGGAGQLVQLPFEGVQKDFYPFSIPPGGTTKLTSDLTGELRVGYGVVYSQSADSQLTGNLVLTLGDREVSVPASPPGKEHHVFAESTGETRSGIAIVNLAGEPQSIDLTLRDPGGESIIDRNIELEPGEKIASFLTELLDLPPFFFIGSLHARADSYFSMIGLRQRNDGSLAVLSSAPSAFPNGGSQILYSLDTGLDLLAMDFDAIEREELTVNELTGAQESPTSHLLNLQNLNSRQAATVVLRYYNDQCQVVLEFMMLLACGERIAFDPFDLQIPGTAFTTRDRFFGPSAGLVNPLRGSQFSSGRFVLSVASVGATLNADDRADLYFPNELGQGSGGSCGVTADRIGWSSGTTPGNLHICNARYMSFDYLSGSQSDASSGTCHGPLWVADEGLMQATEDSRKLIPISPGSVECLVPARNESCRLVEVLESLGRTRCGDSMIGATVTAKSPLPSFELLP